VVILVTLILLFSMLFASPFFQDTIWLSWYLIRISMIFALNRISMISLYLHWIGFRWYLIIVFTQAICCTCNWCFAINVNIIINNIRVLLVC
jgi:hypothetical protein